MIGPMSLRKLVEDLDSYCDYLTVFWKPEGKLSSESSVYLVDLNEEEEPDGLREFIDVWHVRDVIQGKCLVAGLVEPDVSTMTDLLLDYAENGA